MVGNLNTMSVCCLFSCFFLYFRSLCALLVSVKVPKVTRLVTPLAVRCSKASWRSVRLFLLAVCATTLHGRDALGRLSRRPRGSLTSAWAQLL